MYHFDPRLLLHNYISIFILYDLIIFHEYIRFRVKIQPRPLILIYLIVDYLDLLCICDLYSREMILPYLIPEYPCIIRHQYVYATFVTIVDLVLNESATCVVSHIDPATGTPENVVVLCKDPCRLASDHDSGAN